MKDKIVDRILGRICWDWCECSNHAKNISECEFCKNVLSFHTLTRRGLRGILEKELNDGE